jgi:hypothetical protein
LETGATDQQVQGCAMPVKRHLSRLSPAPALVVLCCAAAASPARAAQRPDASATTTSAKVKKLRAEYRRQVIKQPRVILQPAFLQRAQAVGSILPFTVRLRKPYEGGPGDDVLQFAWDAAAVPWPLAGTVPPTDPSTTNLDGAFTYEWDYGADVTGYAGQGAVESLVGGGIAITGSGFHIADADGACTTVKSLDATGITFKSAGIRFGTVNPFSGDVFGTINLRSSVRTRVTACDGTVSPTTQLATTRPGDPPIPVAFYGKISVSPAVASDGKVRLGVLRIADAAPTPQRTTFAMIYACADPAAADGCGRQPFPMRVKFRSLVADVLAGDTMPAPAGDPPIPST